MLFLNVKDNFCLKLKKLKLDSDEINRNKT